MKLGLVFALVGALGFSAACGSDDEKAGSEPEDSGGAPADAGAPPAGAAGATASPGGSGGGGAGGTGGNPSLGGTGGGNPSSGGVGGEPSSGGAAGQGGATTEPGLSLCGPNKYDTGDGCAECPEAPSEPVLVSCQEYVTAVKMDEDLKLAWGLPFHEVQSGEVSISWSDSTDATLPGMAVVSFVYSPASDELFFDLPLEARYADRWSFGSWQLKDACGFVFEAGNLTISYDGEAYGCSDPK